MGKKLTQEKWLHQKERNNRKFKVPVGLLKEAELVFHHQIVEGVEVNEIPDSLVPNLDQASSKYVLVSTTTLAKCKCQSKSQMIEDP